MPKLLGSVLVWTLALLGACGSPSEVTPPPARVAPAGPSKAAPAEPGKAEPAETGKAEPAPTTAAPTEPPPAELPSPLRTAAVREGVITLLRQRDAPLLVIDGEPVPLIDGEFVRHPTGSAGLWPDDLPIERISFTLAATSLPEPLGAWTSTEHEIYRLGSIHEVYRREGARWERLSLRKGPLVAYYAAFVERDGALLALRRWTEDPSEAEPEIDEEDGVRAAAQRAKVARALAKTKPAWVRVAGAEPAVVPEIPAGTTLLGSVTTTASGTLLALASEPAAEGEGERKLLLSWAPNQAKAERIEVPGLDVVEDPLLGSSGEWALIGGSTHGEEGEASYLAIGRDTAWERVPVSLPDRDAELPDYVSGAVRLPDGELWIALADRYVGREGSSGNGGGPVVWRKPANGPWQPVPLPKVGEDPPLAARHATSLVWASGAVWIVVGAGAAYEDETDAPTRSAVLTTLPGTGAPTVLPSEAQLQLERTQPAKPPKPRDR